MQASNVSSLLFKHLSHTAERQKVITGNIANINTPNFKTKELVFENELKMVQTKNDLRLDVTHSNHIRLQAETNNTHKSRVVEVQNLQEQNDGNNVSLDQQISEMSKNRTQFHAIQSAIKKDASFFKEIIAASAKN